MALAHLHCRMILVIAVCCLTCSVVNAESARDIAKKIAPSVVLLVMEDGNGQPLAMGSGFFVKDGIIATNLHVIEGASRGYAKMADRKEKFNISGMVATDAARDIVLLAVDDVKAPPLALGDSKQVAVGDEVYAVGNPRGLEGTFSAGIISSIRKIGDDSLLQITAPISPGSSGGPVVNNKGEVIGVAVATFKGGQNLNFAIPSAYVSVLASATKAVIPLAKGDEGSKPAKVKSILDDSGGRSTEGVTAGQFLWDLPGNEFSGSFSLSFRNQLRDPVRNVLCLIVFADKDGQPVDTGIVTFKGVITPGLAKRVKGQVDGSVKKLTSGNADAPRKIEYRVLYFDLVTGDEPKESERGDAAPAPQPTAPPGVRERSANVKTEDAEAALREAEKRLAETVAKLAPAGNGPDLIESTIAGEFNGWEGETIFNLSNGQTWQQVTYAYTYRYSFRPKVMIIKTNGAYKMKVDGVSSTIFVRRIR